MARGGGRAGFDGLHQLLDYVTKIMYNIHLGIKFLENLLFGQSPFFSFWRLIKACLSQSRASIPQISYEVRQSTTSIGRRSHRMGG